MISLPAPCSLKCHSPKAGSRAAILSPTRELALQTLKVVREMAKFTDLRMAILVGGDAMEVQFAELAANPDILVATPGRLLHHLTEVEGMSLRTGEAEDSEDERMCVRFETPGLGEFILGL